MQHRDDVTESATAFSRDDHRCLCRCQRLRPEQPSSRNKSPATMKRRGNGLRRLLMALERIERRRLSPSFGLTPTFPVLTDHTKPGSQPEGITGNLFKGRIPVR
jgi:hypothetical protein